MDDLKAIRFIEGTKISHDYEGNQVSTFSYRELMEGGVPAIGIPAKQNGLIIVDIDVAGATHKHDGREWWNNFTRDNIIPDTYTVGTRSGGFHYYFRLPTHINPDTFSPPAMLANGVDIKWNGWVAAPPSSGYSIIKGNVSMITEAPEVLMQEISHLIHGRGHREFDATTNPVQAIASLHQPFSPEQLKDLDKRLDWLQTSGELSYAEWRDGLFAIKAGVEDPDTLQKFVDKWTYNRNYQEGDEHKAADIIERAAKHGAIGPGTIFGILKKAAIREGAPMVQTPFTRQEIFDKSRVPLRVSPEGIVKIEPSESNVAALLGAMFDIDTLYHDIRQDLYIFKGEVHSDQGLVNTLTPMIQSEAFGLGLEKFRRVVISGGLEVLMAVRQIDPHLRWLKDLTWDGVPRIDNFFVTYLHADDSEYVRAVGRNFWIALAARGLRPGCKFDSVVVIEGREGIMKSSLIEAIGGQYTFATSSSRSFEDIDELRKMHQAVIVEVPELIGLVDQEPNKVKAFLSKSHDHIRALFARKAMNSPRGFVLVGTTNEAKYLKANMGLRRFWPVKIPDTARPVDMNGIKCDRDQLFAEAAQRFNAGEKFHIMPKLESQNRIVSSPILKPTIDVLGFMPQVFFTSDVYQRLLLSEFINKGLDAKKVQLIETALMQAGAVEFVDVDGIRKWKYEEVGELFPNIPKEPVSCLSNFL